jgi:UDP-glucose 4-epimerase
MAKILVTGGAGYIGSQMVDMLVQNGHQVVVFDSLVTGCKAAVLNAELFIGDLIDKDALAKCFQENKFDAVMHFAAYIQVNESVHNPAKYYQNNLVAGVNLLDAMVKYGVNKLIFSSSAAVYGEPQSSPVTIDHPKNPLNPYGKTKWLFEEILKDYDVAYKLKTICLRYFNASGADPLGRLGPRHAEVTHLIPLVLKVAAKQKAAIEVFGFNYPTKDGTCVRDYVHVVDLCSAHMLALRALLQDGDSAVYNLGNGQGHSVLEVIKVAEAVTKQPITIIKAERRIGDPAILVADASLAKQNLVWEPQYAQLEQIIAHAWQWVLKRDDTK